MSVNGTYFLGNSDVTAAEYLRENEWQEDAADKGDTEHICQPWQHPVYNTYHTLLDAFWIQVGEDMERVGFDQFRKLANESERETSY